ncbi:RDD family protein [Microbacterium sp.]|uniref:RDD family protein n=1 Tax=Microbacterium sp. TaxID=51671 RepID=UPI003A890DC7
MSGEVDGRPATGDGPAGAVPGMTTAPYATRAVATLIEVAAVAVLAAPILIPVRRVLVAAASGDPMTRTEFVWLLPVVFVSAVPVVSFLLVQLLFVAWRGVSLGRAITGLRVVNVHTLGPPGGWPAAVRFLVVAASFLVPVLGPLVVVMLSPLRSRRGRGWPDRAAQTWVVELRDTGSAAPQMPDARARPDGDANRVASCDALPPATAPVVAAAVGVVAEPVTEVIEPVPAVAAPTTDRDGRQPLGLPAMVPVQNLFPAPLAPARPLDPADAAFAPARAEAASPGGGAAGGRDDDSSADGALVLSAVPGMPSIAPLLAAPPGLLTGPDGGAWPSEAGAAAAGGAPIVLTVSRVDELPTLAAYADITTGSRTTAVKQSGTAPIVTVSWDTGGDVEISPGGVVFGRAPTITPAWSIARAAVIRDATRSISRTHLAVTVRGGSVIVVEQGSTNGTQRLRGTVRTTLPPGEAVTLDDGDLLVMGQRSAVVRIR